MPACAGMTGLVARGFRWGFNGCGGRTLIPALVCLAAQAQREREMGRGDGIVWMGWTPVFTGVTVRCIEGVVG